MKTSKFQYKVGDFDFAEYERKINGRITKNRRKAIERMVRVFNDIWSAPYGKSKNGYPYTCGCSHDCCGCLSTRSADLQFSLVGGMETATITISESFNY